MPGRKIADRRWIFYTNEDLQSGSVRCASQERFRTLVLAVAGTECIPMPTPTHSSERFVNVRQAIGHLPPLQAGDAGSE